MLLLDTHAIIWLASDLSQIPSATQRAIRDQAGKLLFSGISGLEIALAVKRGRLVLPTSPESFIEMAARQHGITEIPVSYEIGCLAADLPDIHNDPFDRIIIATAFKHRAQICTKDRRITEYPDVDVVW